MCSPWPVVPLASFALIALAGGYGRSTLPSMRETPPTQLLRLEKFTCYVCGGTGDFLRTVFEIERPLAAIEKRSILPDRMSTLGRPGFPVQIQEKSPVWATFL